MSSRSGSTPVRSTRILRKRIKIIGIFTAAAAIVLLGAAAWMSSIATTINSELQSATRLVPNLKAQIAANDAEGAAQTVEDLIRHTGAARDAADDPVWTAATAVPWLGPNVQTATEVARSADDVARLGAAPLVNAFHSLNWATLAPSPSGMDLEPLKAAAPQVDAAAHAVRESSNRLNEIDTQGLLPSISSALVEARTELAGLGDNLDVAADAARIAPAMMGADTPRRYLLLMQNNAESRATGGIPGALAVLAIDKGSMNLASQTSATALGSFVPPLTVDAEQQAIFSPRIGRFMQDVNLTPDFATSAATAQAMWEERTGERVDGVLSLDPVALSFILEATGPVNISDPLVQQAGAGLPTALTGGNVVQTLLSDAYKVIEEPKLQDVYFAGAAKEVFGALSSGKADPKKLLTSLAKGVEERRILLWSSAPEEQTAIDRYPLGGRIAGAAVAPAQFGIYFNDGTGAKMDYWVKRSIKVVKDCTRDGYREVTVKVTSTNTAPVDAPTSLPEYVTGAGAYGVPPGSVQTNIVVYGPVQSNIDTVVKDGKKVAFAAQRHSNRAVGTSTIRLAPGESTSLEFNFGHIVQHSTPEIVVTPTTQPVSDVIQATIKASCE
ncbi:DUF4012 domain-containing protein [Paenarthrobacter sp. MSM-2-10-13]|nr:DUF4012 domain-containing protein [Paenarthrobacter sp. MSM-2-10-13]